MELSEIKKYLDRGDYVKIARLAGYENLTTGRKTVYRILSGRYPSDGPFQKMILQKAEEVADHNRNSGKLPNQ